MSTWLWKDGRTQKYKSQSQSELNPSPTAPRSRELPSFPPSVEHEELGGGTTPTIFLNETDPPARTTPPRVMQVVAHAAQVTLEDDYRTGYITIYFAMGIDPKCSPQTEHTVR